MEVCMEQQGDEAPILIGQTGPLTGERWLIHGDMLIGRDSSCQICIPDRQISRYHARITQSTKGITLEDMGSKNGTYRNGALIDDVVSLQDGDMIQVALVQTFVYLCSDSTLPLDASELPVLQPAGLLLLDSRSRKVWINHQEITPPLSAVQFQLLQVLYDQKGGVVSRVDLINAIWGEKEALGVSEQALDALIRRTRSRLAEFDPDHAYILTSRGYGLRLDNPKK
jgi:hypothetical protein